MNQLLRTIKEGIETNLHARVFTLDKAQGKRPYQLVKYVTGAMKAHPSEYEITIVSNYDSYDSLVIRGRIGFIRVTLTPLFQIV